MKAVIVATAMTMVLLALVTVAFRLSATERRARRMMVIYLGCVIAAVSIWFQTPVDLGFLARSLRILIDVEEASSHAVDVDWLIVNYGGGNGLTWMYRKRIEGLIDTKLVSRKAGMIELTKKGERTADVFFAVRRFLRIEPQW